MKVLMGYVEVEVLELFIEITRPFHITFDPCDSEDRYGSVNFDIGFRDRKSAYSVSFLRNDWVSYEDYDRFVHDLRNFKDAHFMSLDGDVIFSLEGKTMSFSMEKEGREGNMRFCSAYNGNIDYRYTLIDAFSTFPKWW